MGNKKARLRTGNRVFLLRGTPESDGVYSTITLITQFVTIPVKIQTIRKTIKRQGYWEGGGIHIKPWAYIKGTHKRGISPALRQSVLNRVGNSVSKFEEEEMEKGMAKAKEYVEDAKQNKTLPQVVIELQKHFGINIHAPVGDGVDQSKV